MHPNIYYVVSLNIYNIEELFRIFLTIEFIENNIEIFWRNIGISYYKIVRKKAYNKLIHESIHQKTWSFIEKVQ